MSCRIVLHAGTRHQPKSESIMSTDSETAAKNLKIITDALAGDSQDQREIAFIGLATTALMVTKNEDYGGSVFQAGALSPDVTPEQGIRVRIGDKLSRINNLVNLPGNQRVSESLEDTGHDASAYLLLWVIARMRASGVEVCGQVPIFVDGGPTMFAGRWGSEGSEGFGGPALPKKGGPAPAMYSADTMADVAAREDAEFFEESKKRVH